MATHNDQLANYYHRSRLGYHYLLWDSQHFGYHPLPPANCNERVAQIAMQDQVALALDLKLGERVLDAGSGRGVTAIHLAEKYGAHVTGIEVVPMTYEIAKHKHRASLAPDRLEFVLGSYDQTGFANATFDAIFTLETLSHAQDLGAALRELYRVLRPGGRIALFEYSLAPDAAFTGREMRMVEAVMEGSAMASLKQFRHDGLPALLGLHGFEAIQIREINAHTEPSLRRFRQLAWVPYQFVRLCGSQAHHPNMTSAVEFYPLGKKDLIRYNIIRAVKP